MAFMGHGVLGVCRYSDLINKDGVTENFVVLYC